MRQARFAWVRFERFGETTCRGMFLAEMEAVEPCKERGQVGRTRLPKGGERPSPGGTRSTRAASLLSAGP